MYTYVGVGLGWAQASAGPLDYFKLTLGEGGIRTPLIVSGPGIDSSSTVHSFLYVTDIMPTILEFAGVEHPEQFRGHEVERMRGRSFADVTFGSREDTYPEDALIGAEMNFGLGSWRLFNTAWDQYAKDVGVVVSP